MRHSARCKIKASDVAPYASDQTTCGVLRKPDRGVPPHPYDASPPPDATLQHADADTIISSAEALLSQRLRRGFKILRDPYLLLKFIQMRLVAQPYPIFAVFFLDRKHRLIRFAELFRGAENRVDVRPKEVDEAMNSLYAEAILCVRSDPHGDLQPTAQDVEDAKRLKRAMELIAIELIDCVIVGKSLTSLRVRGVI